MLKEGTKPRLIDGTYEGNMYLATRVEIASHLILDSTYLVRCESFMCDKQLNLTVPGRVY